MTEVLVQEETGMQQGGLAAGTQVKSDMITKFSQRKYASHTT